VCMFQAMLETIHTKILDDHLQFVLGTLEDSPRHTVMVTGVCESQQKVLGIGGPCVSAAQIVEARRQVCLQGGILQVTWHRHPKASQSVTDHPWQRRAVWPRLSMSTAMIIVAVVAVLGRGEVRGVIVAAFAK
jgi:hypothetical protein